MWCFSPSPTDTIFEKSCAKRCFSRLKGSSETKKPTNLHASHADGSCFNLMFQGFLV